MNRTLPRLALTAALALSASGCFGRFPIVHKILEINGSVGNKLIRTVVFWAFVILPVYGIAALVDAWIFNLIEFWTEGGNPLAQRLPDGTEVTATRVSSEVLKLERRRDGVLIDTLELVKLPGEAGLVRRASGEVLVSAEGLADGGVAITDGAGSRVVSGAMVKALATNPSELAAAARRFAAPCVAGR